MKFNMIPTSKNYRSVATRVQLPVIVFSLLVGPIAKIAEADNQLISFRKDIATIFLENCVVCHGPKKAEGGYRIDNFDELAKPGDTGELPVVAAAAASGELIRRITSSDKSVRMPADADPLTPAQIEVVKRWVVEGAKFDGNKGSDPLNLVVPPRVYPDPPATYPVPAPITAMVFSPNGSLLLVGGYHEVTVWNTVDGTLARRIKNIGQRVYSIVFLADNKTIAVAGGEPGKNGEVRLMDFESGLLKGVVGRTNDVVLDISVMPIGIAAADPANPMPPTNNELAIASADGLIRIVNTDTLAEVRTIANHADWVTAIAWSDDGSRLVSGSRDKSAKVFDAKNGELLVSYAGHAAAVRGVAFLPDGKQVVSTGTDKKLHRWEVEGAKKVTEVSIGGEGYKIVRGDTFAFVSCADNQLRRINLSDNKISLSLAGYGDWVLSAAMHAGTNRVAGGALNGEVQLWNATDGAIVCKWIAKP